ncbi:FAS1 domain-containing protein [Wickerhamomyces ciferrii]|uniref:FAS1 domain-containing protein n=1 Tax=Wickerhamomyces ciferrii (strain ATCC 14091 / BCRC 22168 / CBS 111 / JCM 3599 / NBRC 0793 / NRRL Y-1031 F-60-10) TaxID=1206466 RepID=K0KEY1_WICCF|nr:FAS1 domain-containing protein [Wickerhamomyces ciferrii]CCH41511.1 FAS1 domain-containing protein [Wickerhamomyces ciferrii]
MKLQILTLLTFISLALAKRVYDYDRFKAEGDKIININKRDQGIEQQPIFSIPKIMDPKKIYIPEGEGPQQGPTLLTSSLSILKDVSVFASYVRDNVDISTRFNNKHDQTIVFAPKDSGIESLGLKPWQFPNSIDEDTKSEQEIDELTQKNINDFIKSHIVDGTVPFNALDDNKKGVQFVTQNGKNIKLVNDEGDYYCTAVTDGKDQEWIKVEKTIDADNGVILLIGTPLSIPLNN